MPRLADRWQPGYLPLQPIANGATVTGAPIALDGAAAATVQVSLSGGAAGTLYVDATNDDGAGATWVTPTSQTVAANSNGFFSYTLTDQVTGFAQMRVRFTASAAGNVTVKTNIRRYITP